MKWLYTGLVISFLTLIGLLMIRSEPPLIVVVSPRSYSRYYTDPLETLSIDLMTTNPDHYYFDDSYIEQVTIGNEEVQMAFELTTIQVAADTYMMDNEEFALVRFSLRPAIVLRNSVFQAKEATVTVHYSNGDDIQLAIGDVSYAFAPSNEGDFTIGNRQATYGDINGMESVMAINFDLTNRSDQVVVIKRIDVVSALVHTNLAMVRTDHWCEEDTVAGCLLVEDYNQFLTGTNESLQETIFPDQTWTVYVPFLYDEPTLLHRFALAITYEIKGEEHTVYIDDFPYMRSDSFQPSYEQRYIQYELD